MPCKNCKCEMTCKSFARCVLEPVPEEDGETPNLEALQRRLDNETALLAGRLVPGGFDPRPGAINRIA